MQSSRSQSRRIVRRIVRSKSRDAKAFQVEEVPAQPQTTKHASSFKDLDFTQQLNIIQDGLKSGSSSQSTADNTPAIDFYRRKYTLQELVEDSPHRLLGKNTFRLVRRTRTMDNGQTINQYQKSEFPCRGRNALYRYSSDLSMYEQAEILEYDTVYFIGKLQDKIKSYKFTDDEGFYIAKVNDQIKYRYEIHDLMGRGSFGTALRCLDHKYNNYVAVKIMKRTQQINKDIEITALCMLKANNTQDRYPVVNIMKHFKFRGHQCIVFELLSINLYTHLKQQPQRRIDLNRIRLFAKQILEGLKYIHDSGIIHCDLKPENILLRHPTTNQIKIIDFGTCCLENQCNYTYVQSRYYRAPEVILGCPFSFPADIWSLGVILTELYTGYPIFRGEDEYEQLLQIVATMGEPPFILLRNAKRAQRYFNKNSIMVKPNKAGEFLMPNSRPFESLFPEDVNPDFLSFIKACFRWRPMTRITPEEGLNHEFIQGEYENPVVKRRRERRARKAAMANNEKN